MRVTLHPCDDTGCGHYRMYYPGRALAGELDVRFETEIPGRASRTEPRRITSVGQVYADVVVLQRPMLRLVGEAIPFIRAQGVAVVVDIDDDMGALHPNHVAHAHMTRDMNGRHLHRACAAADLVTVTTPALAERYGSRGNAVVIPNYVPRSLTDVPRGSDGRTVGWSGFAGTHPGDLAVTLGGVADAVRDAGARFLSVGPVRGVAEGLGLPEDPSSTGPVPFEGYPAALALLDVGIVPLLDSKFNAAKSCLKGLEYAALGVPFVASPRADYARLNADGIGLLAGDKRKDWRRRVGQLLADPAAREEVALMGREAVRERHTYETEAWRWAEAWAEAVERRRLARAA